MSNSIQFYLSLLVASLPVSFSYSQNDSAHDILLQVVNTIDTIETIYYKQDMSRTNPRNLTDTIYRFREMYFKRLSTDSIVGVKGHWYMYVDDKEHVIYEDIYDGNRLLRKNNRDSVVMVYDLVKYPKFRVTPFWGHNTPYGMQYEFRYILQNLDTYVIDRLKDTLLNEKNCFQLKVNLKDKVTMPGFAIKLEDKKGQVSTNFFYIDKSTFYPVKMKGESFSSENTDPKIFIEQHYYDIKINIHIDEDFRFNTSLETIPGFSIQEMKP